MVWAEGEAVAPADPALIQGARMPLDHAGTGTSA